MVNHDRPRGRRRLGALLVGLLAIVVIFICAKTSSTPPGPGQAEGTATVVKIVDGDTMHVSTAAGTDVVRVLGIDTPETRKPRTPVQCGGPEASAFAHQLLDGQQVSLVADSTQADRDRYHRLLRYIRLADGRDYSVEAARAGMARNYIFAKKPVQEQSAIEAAEADARNEHRGLWGRCSG